MKPDDFKRQRLLVVPYEEAFELMCTLQRLNIYYVPASGARDSDEILRGVTMFRYLNDRLVTSLTVIATDEDWNYLKLKYTIIDTRINV